MKLNAIRLLKTMLAMYVFTAILLSIFTFVCYKAVISDGKIWIGVIAIYILTCFIGGYINGKMAENKKYIHGLCAGVAYFMILLIISAITSNDFSFFSGETLVAFLSCFISGMIGGMLS